MQLPEWHNTYLVLTGEDIPVEVRDVIKGITHVPGLSCQACGAHLDTGFIRPKFMGPGLELMGIECISSSDAEAWYAVMKRARYYIDYQHFKVEQSLGRNQLTAFRGLALISQLHPWLADFAELFSEVVQNRTISPNDLQRIQTMVKQLGGLGTLLKHRDQLRRLHVLELIIRRHPDRRTDRNTITSLLMQGRNHILTENQNHLIHALMDRYNIDRMILLEQLLYRWDQHRKRLDL